MAGDYWRLKVDVSDLSHHDGDVAFTDLPPSFQVWHIARKLLESGWLDLYEDGTVAEGSELFDRAALEELLHESGSVDDAHEANNLLATVYEYADRDRVWIKPWWKDVATDQVG